MASGNIRYPQNVWMVVMFIRFYIWPFRYNVFWISWSSLSLVSQRGTRDFVSKVVPRKLSESSWWKFILWKQAHLLQLLSNWSSFEKHKAFYTISSYILYFQISVLNLHFIIQKTFQCKLKANTCSGNVGSNIPPSLQYGECLFCVQNRIR